MNTNMVTRKEGMALLNKRRSANKFHAKKTVVDGITFDSKHEADVYADLKMEKLAGTIVAMALQVKFPIVFKDQKICVYIADFVVKYRDGRDAVIDAKGVKTPVYRLKKKLMSVVNNIVIEER